MDEVENLSRQYGTRDVMHRIGTYIHGDVLDFGAGNGKQKALILQYARSYTSLDISPHAAPDILGDVLNPPISDAQYDTIVSTQVMEHVRQPWTMVQQMARLLRPGGTAIVTAPFNIPYHADPQDYFRFTEEGMRSLFEDAGMTVVLCAKHGGFWAFVGEVVKQKFFSPYRKKSWLQKRLANPVESVFRLLNRLFLPGSVYANVLCIATKP